MKVSSLIQMKGHRLRRHLNHFLSVGHIISQFHLVPPRQQLFLQLWSVSDSCLILQFSNPYLFKLRRHFIGLTYFCFDLFNAPLGKLKHLFLYLISYLLRGPRLTLLLSNLLFEYWIKYLKEGVFLLIIFLLLLRPKRKVVLIWVSVFFFCH